MFNRKKGTLHKLFQELLSMSLKNLEDCHLKETYQLQKMLQIHKAKSYHMKVGSSRSIQCVLVYLLQFSYQF